MATVRLFGIVCSIITRQYILNIGGLVYFEHTSYLDQTTDHIGYSTTILAVFLAPIFALFAIVSYSIREVGNAACVDRTEGEAFSHGGLALFRDHDGPRHNQPSPDAFAVTITPLHTAT